MKALVYYGNKDIRLEQNWPDPKLKNDDERVWNGGDLDSDSGTRFHIPNIMIGNRNRNRNRNHQRFS